MDYLSYALVATVILAFVLYLDREYIKHYIGLGLFTMLLAFIFRNAVPYLGTAFSATIPLEPVSVITLFLYFHYSCFCYFAGNMIMRRFSND